jgi:hypothetical protein
VSKLHAQGNDPVLAGMIALYTDKAKKELKQQEQMMLLEATGHIWITEEVNATTDLQKEFNKYLDDFHSIIAYAAQIYGFYHEIDRMVDNLGSFNDQLSAHPTNALAVALSSLIGTKSIGRLSWEAWISSMTSDRYVFPIPR